MTVYSNNLYEGGDILAAEAECAVPGTTLSPSAPKAAAGANQKFKQQRAMAAQVTAQASRKKKLCTLAE